MAHHFRCLSVRKYLASDSQETGSPVLPYASIRCQAFRLADHPKSQRQFSDPYLSGENLLTTLRHKAIPYIPFKTNSKAQSTYGPKSTLWTRMLSLYTDHREEFLTHYHKRSNVETTFHMIKSKFGQRLRSKTLTAQINEALCKVLCHNLCVVIQSVHELGIETDFSTEEAA